MNEYHMHAEMLVPEEPDCFSTLETKENGIVVKNLFLSFK